MTDYPSKLDFFFFYEEDKMLHICSIEKICFSMMEK